MLALRRVPPVARRLGWLLALVLIAAATGCGSGASSPGTDGGAGAGGAGPGEGGADGGSDAGAEGDGGAALPAFPGAQGWAARTTGGRGGQILRVTTLARSGPGSLAAALATPGPRIIVFEVGGVIDLNGSNLDLIPPNATVAGQTAPSPGITIIRGGLRIQTSNVIVQHLRVRPGEAGRAKMSGWEVDSLATNAAFNVIVDHCSTSWGTDENLSASGERFLGATPDDWRRGTSHSITFSNNIIAEGLASSTHAEGEHSKGGLIHDNATEIAIIGNLYFSNNERHPLFKGGARGIVVNNYVANPGRWAMAYALNASEWGTHPPEVGHMAIVGNVLRPGPSTPADLPILRITGIGPLEAYFSDNIATTTAGAEATLVGGSAPQNATIVTTPSSWPAGLAAAPASGVADHVRQNVGARPWDRDEVDIRIIEQALAGEGRIIDSEQDVGGYPTHAETRAPFVEDEWDLTYMIRKNGAP